MRQPSSKIKAAFLLLVFTSSTMIGFACSVGIDFGLKTTHHHSESAIKSTVHLHADGKKHLHNKSHHDKTDGHQHQSKDSKENCCNNDVIKFVQVDKAIPQSFALHPIFLIAFISPYYDIDVIFTAQVAVHIRYFVRSYHPPISDIRIAIQSFQI